MSDLVLVRRFSIVLPIRFASCHAFMQKRLAVYSISKEKTRLAFGAAVCEKDKECVDLIDEHATAFHSDKSLEELHKILVSSCIESGDEVWILTLTDSFTGIGIALLNDLRAFFSK
jgi:hypothetical protein